MIYETSVVNPPAVNDHGLNLSQSFENLEEGISNIPETVGFLDIFGYLLLAGVGLLFYQATINVRVSASNLVYS